MKFLTALLAVVGAVPTVWHAPHQKAPAEGFTKITYQLKIDSLTFHGQGYYGLTQSWLQTGQPIYGGLSINVNGVRRTMFAIFGDNGEPVDPGCEHAMDNGWNVSRCWLPFEWEFDTWYTYEYKVVKKLDDGRWQWNATLTDEQNNSHHIGLVISNSTAKGTIGLASQWWEFIPFNDGKTPADRPCQPYGKAYMKPPVFEESTSYIAQRLKDALFDTCAIAAGKPNTRSFEENGGTTFEAGFLSPKGTVWPPKKAPTQPSSTLKASSALKASTLAAPKPSTTLQPKPTSLKQPDAKPTGSTSGSNQSSGSGNWWDDLFKGWGFNFGF